MNNEGYSQDSYYMYGANATMPQYKNVDNYQAETKEVKKNKSSLSLKMLAKASLVFVLAVLVVSQYVYIQNLGYGISKSNDELNQILTQNEKLKQQYSSLGELSTVEDYAINTLGMVKAENSFVYVASAMPSDNYAQDEDEKTGIKSLFTSVLGLLN